MISIMMNLAYFIFIAFLCWTAVLSGFIALHAFDSKYGGFIIIALLLLGLSVFNSCF